MAFIDYSYYTDQFKGTYIPEDEFRPLADAASAVLEMLAGENGIPDINAAVKSAAAYQTEMLYIQGGRSAIAGMPSGLPGKSEKLGDYSVSYDPDKNMPGNIYVGGIPVSPVAYAILRRAGIINRWAYSGKYSLHVGGDENA